MQKIIVAAVAQNGVIGNNGTIPWHSREDMQYFKSLTMGSPIIMGRKTYESLGKPLKGRLNIVISRMMKSELPDVLVFASLSEAFKYCENEAKAEKVFIIGGGEIYKEAVTSADLMSLSEMKFEAEGNVFFPEVDTSKWEREVRADYEDFQVIWYKRK
ncbi:MAG TPA: dihydrofolate reductase [Ignavibacteriales bacterium]|nr:dihydrofolate reductase [Ignavibacteriales bacterium]